MHFERSQVIGAGWVAGLSLLMAGCTGTTGATDGDEPATVLASAEAVPWEWAVAGQPYGERLEPSLPRDHEATGSAGSARFELVEGPRGLVLTPDGHLSLTPSVEQVGAHTVTVREWSGGLSRDRSFTIRVSGYEVIAEAVLDSAGGEVVVDAPGQSLDGLRIRVAPGQLTEPVPVSVRRVTGDAPNLPAEFTPMSDWFVVHPAVDVHVAVEPSADLAPPPGAELFVSAAVQTDLHAVALGRARVNNLAHFSTYERGETRTLVGAQLQGYIVITSAFVTRVDRAHASAVWPILPGDPDRSEVLNTALDTFESIRDTYLTLGCDVPERVSFLFERTVDPGVLGLVYASGPFAGNHIIINNREPELFPHAMAHEYYHLLQDRAGALPSTFLERFGREADPRSRWWVEASAELAGGIASGSNLWKELRVPPSGADGLHAPTPGDRYPLAWFLAHLARTDQLNVCSLIADHASFLRDDRIHGVLNVITEGQLRNRLMSYAGVVQAMPRDSLLPGVSLHPRDPVTTPIGPSMLAHPLPRNPEILEAAPFPGARAFRLLFENTEPMDVRIKVDATRQSFRTTLFEPNDAGTGLDERWTATGALVDDVLRDVPPGTIMALAMADGTWDREEVSADVFITPLMDMVGTVTCDGPSEGATVTVRQGIVTERTLSIDATGKFELVELPTDLGPYTVSAVCPSGAESDEQTVEVVLDGTPAEVSLSVEPPRTIFGTLRDNQFLSVRQGFAEVVGQPDTRVRVDYLRGTFRIEGVRTGGGNTVEVRLGCDAGAETTRTATFSDRFPDRTSLGFVNLPGQCEARVWRALADFHTYVYGTDVDQVLFEAHGRFMTDYIARWFLPHCAEDPMSDGGDDWRCYCRASVDCFTYRDGPPDTVTLLEGPAIRHLDTRADHSYVYEISNPLDAYTQRLEFIARVFGHCPLGDTVDLLTGRCESQP